MASNTESTPSTTPLLPQVVGVAMAKREPLKRSAKNAGKAAKAGKAGKEGKEGKEETGEKGEKAKTSVTSERESPSPCVCRCFRLQRDQQDQGQIIEGRPNNPLTNRQNIIEERAWEIQIIIEQRPNNPLKNTPKDTVPIGIWILGASDNTVIHDPQSQQPTTTKKKTKTKGARGAKGTKGMKGAKGMKGMTENMGGANKVKGYLKASSLSLRCSLPLGVTPWDVAIVRTTIGRRENKERRRRRRDESGDERGEREREEKRREERRGAGKGETERQRQRETERDRENMLIHRVRCRVALY